MPKMNILDKHVLKELCNFCGGIFLGGLLPNRSPPPTPTIPQLYVLFALLSDQNIVLFLRAHKISASWVNVSENQKTEIEERKKKECQDQH